MKKMLRMIPCLVTLLTAFLPLAAGAELERTVKIIAFGDSLTAGYGLALRDSYPMQLQQRLLDKGVKTKFEIINQGISGETTAGALERIDFILEQHPDVVLLTIGGNDSLRDTPLKVTQENLCAIIKKLKTGIESQHIILFSILAPANRGEQYKREFEALFPHLAECESVVVLPFVTEELFSNPSFIQPDGIHPTAEGYRFVVDRYILDTVTAILAPQ